MPTLRHLRGFDGSSQFPIAFRTANLCALDHILLPLRNIPRPIRFEGPDGPQDTAELLLLLFLAFLDLGELLDLLVQTFYLRAKLVDGRILGFG